MASSRVRGAPTPLLRVLVWGFVVGVAYIPGAVALAMIIWGDE